MADVTNVTGGQQTADNLRPASSREEVTQAENTEFSAVESAEQTTRQSSDNANSGEQEASNQDPFERAAEALEALIPAEDLLQNTRLRILLDEEEGRFIYQSVDSISGEVVRQFPPEDILDIINNFRSVEGLAVDRDA